MIDILYSYNQNGPGKVINNLKKGLDLLGIEYRENPNEVSSESKGIALQWDNNILKYNPENIIIGPNICTLPIDNDFVMSQKYKKIITPSEWVKKLYSKWIDETKICIWPVGIDTDIFSSLSQREKEIDCLIYYKRRDLNDLKLAKKILREKGQSYKIIEYGHYSESEFIDLLSKSKYVFLIDNCESQGIAVQEILSTNTPIFVWDVTHWNDRGEDFKVEATSIPFWSDDCGIKVCNSEIIEESLNKFLKKFDFFQPRDYILENLNLKSQAKKIIEFFENN
jgi:hypothetical protein